jgi:hypothetical protein
MVPREPPPSHNSSARKITLRWAKPGYAADPAKDDGRRGYEATVSSTRSGMSKFE